MKLGFMAAFGGEVEVAATWLELCDKAEAYLGGS